MAAASCLESPFLALRMCPGPCRDTSHPRSPAHFRVTWRAPPPEEKAALTLTGLLQGVSVSERAHCSASLNEARLYVAYYVHLRSYGN